jgi:hypothetical protein
MPHPGPDREFDYTDLPYKKDWKPLPDREWALKYCRTLPGDRDDEFGFQNELHTQVPYLFSGSAPSWIPTVDYFVRHDRKGQRLDCDYELARMKPESVSKEQAKAREEQARLDWEKAKAAYEAAQPGTGEKAQEETKPPGPTPPVQAKQVKRELERSVREGN